MRMKLIIMPDEEEDEGERTESDDLSKLQIVPRQPSMDIDQVCENITNSTGLMGFKHIHYDSLDKENQENFEKAMIDMMKKYKYMPIELGKGITKDLYNKLDAKWKWALSIERKIRETTLAQTMCNAPLRNPKEINLVCYKVY